MFASDFSAVASCFVWNKLPNSIAGAIFLYLFKTKIDDLFGDPKYLIDRVEEKHT